MQQLQLVHMPNCGLISRAKGSWKITYPPASGIFAVPVYTGMRTRAFDAVITSFKARLARDCGDGGCYAPDLRHGYEGTAT